MQEVTHLNNQEKNNQLSRQGVGWEDILNQAEELHRSMTVEGNMRWPPQCNINDSRTPPKGCRTNLAQIRNNRNQKGKSNHCNNGQHKKPHPKKKFTRQPKTSWKNKRPKKNQPEKTVDGTPVHLRVVDGRKCWRQMQTQGWMDQLSSHCGT